jgi:hypothetical protein
MGAARNEKVEGMEERPVDLAVDPLILGAAREVDVTLLDWALSLSPRERLRACSRASALVGRFANASSRGR